MSPMGKIGYQSSADACRRRRYFWRKRKCLRPHISHLQWRASIATAATMSLCRYYAHVVIRLFSLGSCHERYNEVAVYVQNSNEKKELKQTAMQDLATQKNTFKTFVW